MMKTELLFLAMLSTLLLQAAPPVEEGKAIFTSRCAGCHNVNKVVLGPALAGVDQRRSMNWIINFVHSSQTMIQKGDQDAVALFKQFNNIPMPDHKDLSNEQIANVVEYIKAEAKEKETAKTAVGDLPQQPANLWQVIVKSPGLSATYVMLSLLLIAVVVFARQVRQLRKKALAGK